MDIYNEIVKLDKRQDFLEDSRAAIGRELRTAKARRKALLSLLDEKDRPEGIPGDGKRETKSTSTPPTLHPGNGVRKPGMMPYVPARNWHLLPCPFCGGEARWSCDAFGFPFVRCANAECGTRQSPADSELEAMEGWNNREGVRDE